MSPADRLALIQRAKAEDLGPDNVDITTRWLIPPDRQGCGVFRPRDRGVLAGAALLPAIIEAYDPALKLEPLIEDSGAIESGQVIARVSGSLASILALERVALNFLIHLCGVATLTHRYVQAVAELSGARAKIYDTRKTTPCLRALEKYAVACGGGFNHRMGLFDALLIKDNHLAPVIDPADLPAVLANAIDQAKAATPPPRFIEIEVDRLDQLAALLSSPVAGQLDVVLLDNMSLDDTRRAVEMRDELAPHLELEASGNVNLANVAQVAATGVDRIAIGAITHSAPALDIGLDTA